tara:strand:- start:15041 stop:15196 length:156 start_codon:yes stop_codon:yes gene_type:complete
MTTIVEKTSEGIIYRAAKSYPVPDVDVLTLLFGKLRHLIAIALDRESTKSD